MIFTNSLRWYEIRKSLDELQDILLAEEFDDN
jgi:hypothetical protein